MASHADLIDLYHKYRQEKRLPFLLESLGPITPYSSHSVLGVNPSRRLIVTQNGLYENDQRIGDPLDIFRHLDIPKSSIFFPAWIGFFSYEFGQFFGLPSKFLDGQFPLAAFYYYENGHYVDRVKADFPPPRSCDLNKEMTAYDASDAFFDEAFAAVIEHIKNGNVYQVNIAKKYGFDATPDDFFEIYKRLRINNPSPFMALIEDEQFSIASASPERLFKIHGKNISSRPIAGTRPRGKNKPDDERLEYELLTSPKERAEHAMLVDLVRNDLARICKSGSVEVNEAFIIERFSHVMHLVSEVTGVLSNSLQNVFASLFPAGTITGTPKESAMEQIRDLEPFTRGGYTGSLGYISGIGVDFNILIRSAFLNTTGAHIYAGAGIVAQSQAKSEGSEVDTKAKSVSHALRNIPSEAVPTLPRPGQSFIQPHSKRSYNLRVCFIENHDSFSHNIVDAMKRLGCAVDVIEHSHRPNLSPYQHIVLGPGPKNPLESGLLMRILNDAIESQKAILGICLGHQALGVNFGSALGRASRAIHGETDMLSHNGHPLFRNVPIEFNAMRYHSLVLKSVPSDFEVIAKSSRDEIMAIAHAHHPWFGVQFHPESFLSMHGHTIFENFFEITQ